MFVNVKRTYQHEGVPAVVELFAFSYVEPAPCLRIYVLGVSQ